MIGDASGTISASSRRREPRSIRELPASSTALKDRARKRQRRHRDDGAASTLDVEGGGITARRADHWPQDHPHDSGVFRPTTSTTPALHQRSALIGNSRIISFGMENKMNQNETAARDVGGRFFGGGSRRVPARVRSGRRARRLLPPPRLGDPEKGTRSSLRFAGRDPARAPPHRRERGLELGGQDRPGLADQTMAQNLRRESGRKEGFSHSAEFAAKFDLATKRQS